MYVQQDLVCAGTSTWCLPGNLRQEEVSGNVPSAQVLHTVCSGTKKVTDSIAQLLALTLDTAVGLVQSAS